MKHACVVSNRASKRRQSVSLVELRFQTDTKHLMLAPRCIRAKSLYVKIQSGRDLFFGRGRISFLSQE